LKKESKQTKHAIKRCLTCKRFIPPTSDSLFCKAHKPGLVTIDDKEYPVEGEPKLKLLGDSFTPEPLVFGEPLKAGEQNDLLTFDNNKVYSRVGDDNFIDIGEFVGGKFVPTNRIPSKDDVDFKTEFVYEGVTADELKQLLSSIKMTFGGSIRYMAYLKRSDENG
jgi:hypothetical protein